MKKIRLLLTMILAGAFSLSSYAQDVEIPFSWVGPGPTNTSSVGLFQCESIEITLNTAGTQHQLSGVTRALIAPGSGNEVVPFTLTFSKPVCNLRILVNDLDLEDDVPVEQLVFSGVLPDGVTAAATGDVFDYAGGVVFPNGADDTRGWVNWNGPVTEINFDYIRDGLGWAVTLDSLSFDCDCSIPADLNCCNGNDWQTLSWADVPGAIGYQINFGFNDNSSGCCDSVTGLPTEWLEDVTDNVFVVPESFEDCFWWRVRSEFADGSFSDWSERMCDCEEEAVLPCVPPINLDCEISTSAFIRTLSWDPVPGAFGYEVSLTYNDPECCPLGPDPETVTFTTTDALLGDIAPGPCFSWKVRTICTEDTTHSEWSETMCSSDCAPPTTSAKGANLETGSTFDPDQISTSKMEVLIVPNPADEFVTITVLGNDDDEMYNNTKVVLTNTSGIQVFEDAITVNRAKEIALKSLVSGVYICTIVSGESVLHSSRLIVK